VLRAHKRRVDGNHDAAIGSRRPQPGDEPCKRRPHIRRIVDDMERQLERVGLLADCDSFVADPAERSPGAFREGLTVEFRKGFRGTEAAARAADEQDPGQPSSRHGSV
jgi:hypothetical protein